MRIQRYLQPLGLCVALLSSLAGCRREDPLQLKTIELFGQALHKRNLKLACGLVVKELQDEVNCEGLVVTLMHYSPGFPGSKLSRRAPSSGGRLSQSAVVPVAYAGEGGSGKLDVTLRKVDGGWRIALLMPVP